MKATFNIIILDTLLGESNPFLAIGIGGPLSAFVAHSLKLHSRDEPRETRRA